MKRKNRIVWMAVGVLFFAGVAQAAVTAGNWDSPGAETTWAGSALPDVMSVWKSQLAKTYRSPGLVSSAKSTGSVGSGLRGKVIFGHISLDGLSPAFSTGVPSSSIGTDFFGVDSNVCKWNVPSLKSYRHLVTQCPSDFGECSNGNGRGTPVIPAPGAIVLGAIGMTAVGWLRRRRMV